MYIPNLTVTTPMKKSDKLKNIYNSSLNIAELRVSGVDLPDSPEWARVRSFKGLDRVFTDDIKTESKALQESIYWDWYQFVRMSKIIWFSKSRNVLPRDKKMAQVCKDFVGAIEFGVFVVWAMKFARTLFAETKQFDLVTRYDPSNPPDDLSVDDELILRIPLNIPRVYLIPQIINFLGQYHPGRELDVLEKAHTALYKLHTLRFRRNVLEIERLVYVYKNLYPETQLWVIADRLQLAPNNNVRDDRFYTVKKHVYNRLNSVAGRHLYKAKRRILHVERGSFPNANDITVSDRVQPFGRDLHPEFLSATEGDQENLNAPPSEWKQWLHNEYHGWLVREVLKRNHIDRETVDMNSVPAFLSGTRSVLDKKPISD
jgi:hypothetical protein